MAKKAKRGSFRAAVGGEAPAGVGHTAGVNRNAFGSKYSVGSKIPVGGGLNRSSRKPARPNLGNGYGIKAANSGGDLVARAQSIFGTVPTRGKVRGGGSDGPC